MLMRTDGNGVRGCLSLTFLTGKYRYPNGADFSKSVMFDPQTKTQRQT